MSSQSLIKSELLNSKLLIKTADNSEVRLTTFAEAPNTLKEIARLRELTFNKIGEGTGEDLDIDRFDEYYKHLILWNENNEEIIGAYRICVGNEILRDYSLNGFYTSTLFDFNDTFVKDYLPHSIELGRSFIQPKYWRSNALDRLWYGIGAVVRLFPQTKYFFGAVSISNTFNTAAKNTIVYYYNKWFAPQKNLVSSKNRFIIPENTQNELKNIFNSESSKKDYIKLKSLLKPMGYTVPVLFKQYTDLCDEGGVQFHDFGIDEKFGSCIDGFLLVDLSFVKKEKYERYYVIK